MSDAVDPREGSPRARRQRLLDEARAGNKAAQEQIYRTLTPSIQRGVRRQLRRHREIRAEADWEDLVQQVLLRLHEGFLRTTIPALWQAFEAYLHKVIRSCVADVIKRQSRQKRGETPSVSLQAAGVEPASRDFRPDQHAELRELERRFWEQWESLPPLERRVLAFRCWLGLPWKALADISGLSPCVLRRLYRKALSRLLP